MQAAAPRGVVTERGKRTSTEKVDVLVYLLWTALLLVLLRYA